MRCATALIFDAMVTTFYGAIGSLCVRGAARGMVPLGSDRSIMHDWVRELSARRFPAGPRSQGGQDGILAAIFRHVQPVNAPPFCIEFGFNADTLDGGSGPNVATLVLDHGWKALLLDADHENPAINLRRELLTSANVVDVFRKWGVPPRPDYVSIDVDSTDLWLFRALLTTCRAAVYSVEYNSHFPLDVCVTCADDPEARWQGDRAYGASLRALDTVARERGYSLVAMEPGLDAFFVRDDLLDDGSGELAPPLEHWRPATLLLHHPPVLDARQVGRFLDYDVWRATGGDTVAARRAAAAACRRWLCAGAWQFRLKKLLARPRGILRRWRCLEPR
jgi:hypothetical protein